jgi:heme-degrading monooxygenase HmoA
MLYTLFFSKMRDLSPTEMDEYHERVGALKDLATAEHPGFVDIKTYVAEDGDRLTVARFRDAESQRAWRLVPEHREAQARGRTHYYEHFHIVVCEEVRSHEFVRQAGDRA